MAMTINIKPESIIEYSQNENSPVFSYDKKTGVIFIKAEKSEWLWREKLIKTNCILYYDTDRYKLLFISKNLRKFDSKNKIMLYCNHISLYNTGFLPKFIKKGEVLGEITLIPKIDSHVLKTDIDLTESL